MSDMDLERIEYEDLPEEARQAFDRLQEPWETLDEPIAICLGMARDYPGFVFGRLNLGVLLLEQDDSEGARAVYESLENDFPGEPRVTAGMSMVLASEGNAEGAEALATQALEAGCQWGPCYGIIGRAQESRGEHEAAAETYLAGYQFFPHAWQYLQQYCQLMDIDYCSPEDDEVPDVITLDQLVDLSRFIDTAGHTPDDSGEPPGCDHTFRFTNQWAEANDVDPIFLYQFLNGYGGFCDCEVCLEVEPALVGAEGA